MGAQLALRPADVAVALKLATAPGATYVTLASDLGISASTAYEAVERLVAAGLVREESREVNRHALLEFLEHGLRYVFPPELGGPARGVPTAHAVAPLARELIAEDKVVWTDPNGSAYGTSLTPLYPGAPGLPSRSPAVYEMLALVDALRIGRARERSRAAEHLRERLYAAA